MFNSGTHWDPISFQTREHQVFGISQKVWTFTVRCLSVRLLFLLTGYQVCWLAAALCKQIRVEEGWRPCQGCFCITWHFGWEITKALNIRPPARISASWDHCLRPHLPSSSVFGHESRTWYPVSLQNMRETTVWFIFDQESTTLLSPKTLLNHISAKSSSFWFNLSILVLLRFCTTFTKHVWFPPCDTFFLVFLVVVA